MQDGQRIRGAGPLRGLCRCVRGGIARVSETWGDLGYAGTTFLGRAWSFIPGWRCLLRTGGQEAWHRLGARKSVRRRPVRGARGRLCCRLPVFPILAVALARGFVPRHMQGAGVGSSAGLPLRPAPLSDASYRRRLGVSGLGDRRRCRLSGSGRPRLAPGAEPGG